jgi:hypothetical protein
MKRTVSRFFAEETRRERSVLRQFEDSLRSGDVQALSESIAPLDGITFGWKRAFQRAERFDGLSPNVKHAFLQAWLYFGDHIRQEVGRDLLLIRGLRVLLPSYEGPSMILYRAERFFNWKRRTYGPSWSSGREVADQFALTETYRTSQGGSVVLKVTAMPEHILCAPIQHDNGYGEDEYILDRRGLRGVTVVRRYSQLSHEDYYQQYVKPSNAT